MIKRQNGMKRSVVLCVAAVAALAASSMPGSGSDSTFGFIRHAHAAEQGSGAGSAGGQRGQGGRADQAGGGHMGGKGSSIDKKVFRTSVDEDSDRPPWAGVKGGKSGGGGKPFGAGTKKGDLYGDMYILLRDANGVPILVDGLEQVVAFVYAADGTLVPLLDGSGNPVAIPYTAEGDLATTITIGTTTYDVYPGEVDLGRLSVGRSPSKVLDHALSEALSKLTSGTVTLDASGRLVVDGVPIDSPLENLALYEVYMQTGTLPGVTLPAGFDPAALLAAAADKTGAISVDTVVYMNSILGINTTGSYYDFSTYDYDRVATWADVNVTVLVLQPDGSYLPTLVNVYQTLFNSTSWTDPTTDGGADDFATAANDYLQVLEFVHDNEVR
ncbi:hypothetical protein CJ010_21450 [Azoarcus sp. DD4]|uniref:hypothetical protein n=1 Tax=Azoarcus sp. DD4 TaxID=2027405 RepID=UPI00112B6135|nr:hypothetical protein [Azoarcus sp. DD4]QDF98919.1 hypothetical protein CJ010_21450 [Azoarcus sp. DD4]